MQSSSVDLGFELQQWRLFVSLQLRRLRESPAAINVRSDISQNGDVIRFVVPPQSAGGRAIMIPSTNFLLPPPKLPPRAKKDLLSGYSLKVHGQNTTVNVPWSRVVRDYKFSTPRPQAVDSYIPIPVSIIVISAYDPATGHQRFGWFVRYSDDKTGEIVQVPYAVAKELQRSMEAHPVLYTSSLCSKYALRDDGLDFLELAHKSYQRIYSNIKSELKRKREPPSANAKRPVADPKRHASELPTCVVCLEDSKSAIARCPHETCKAATCSTCHQIGRGLCPICDREGINADYPCSACGQLARLQAYGLPCITCKSATLCKSCYTTYEECRPCEARKLSIY